MEEVTKSCKDHLCRRAFPPHKPPLKGQERACHGELSLRGVAGGPCKDRSGRYDFKPKRPLCKIEERLKPKDYLSTSTARALAERDWLWRLSGQGFWRLFLLKQQQSLWIINSAFSWGQNAQNWLQRKWERARCNIIDRRMWAGRCWSLLWAFRWFTWNQHWIDYR